MERQKRRAWKPNPLVDLVLMGVIAGVAVAALTLPAHTESTGSTQEAVLATEQTEAPETMPAETQPETTAPAELVTLYDVPLSEELQLHIIQESKAHGIDPAVTIAVIWRESTYRATAKGDSGKSLGLMQIQPRWHRGRMDLLGCTDLLDPFQNVTVGVDILADLIDKYDGNVAMALMAYNAGSSGANQHWFSKGIYSNDYSKAVLNKAAQLETYQATI